ncbi:MAG: hypothetical protein Q8R98_25740 [Rubrivivax sp.]|nr:hypothetical protein [Rubrivivax sp.]MDP3224078.1 hypothetical protein [Rubrivivax sp.]MDP3615258.1 hypothetical protein [Rubrivivax sp.]
MLDGLKRLFTNAPSEGGDWDGVAPWAQSKQYTFRAVQSEGFVIDGRLGATPWRLEWGPSQRPYIQGQELRIRSELGLASELQLVLMNRQLQEQMEKDVFDQYVEGVQTRIDNQTPPEMRWLVMFPKLAGSEMPELRERYVALSSMKSWLVQWLQGPLSQAITSLRIEPETPMVLMIGRGRLMLRTALPDAQVGALQGWLRLFEAAMREARRVANESSDSISPSTQPSMWSSSALPGDERNK